MSSNPVKKIERKLRNAAPDLKPRMPEPTYFGPRYVERRAEDFETREQALGQQARAAGATRLENDADLLGYVLPRRKGVQRTLGG
jgi:hypothetical protein